MTLKPGYGPLKVIRTDAYRSATCDFLLTLHSNHGPISYCFRNKLRFQSKITKFPTHPVYFALPLKGYRCSRSKNQNDGATGPRKKFDDIFSRLDIMHQRDRRTDGQTDRQTDTGRQQRPHLRIASRGKNNGKPLGGRGLISTMMKLNTEVAVGSDPDPAEGAHSAPQTP